MIYEDERRRFMRLAMGTAATLTRVATQERVQVEVIDLSANGCAFYTELTFTLGEAVEFFLPGATERIPPLHRRGRITRLSDEAGRRLVALEFAPD